MNDPRLPIRRAIVKNDVSLVQRLLRAHPKYLHNADQTPEGNANSNLHLAAMLGHTDVCRLLVNMGHELDRDVEGQETLAPAVNNDHQTALMLAAAKGHTEVVHFLCEYNPASIMHKDKKWRNAIMEACIGGHDTVLQILLTYVPGGAEAAVNVADIEGNTPLHHACTYGHLLVMRTLLAAGANPRQRNLYSWLPEQFSLTVQVEVYYKKLVAEMEKTKAEETSRAAASSRNGSSRQGNSVRMVQDHDEE